MFEFNAKGKKDFSPLHYVVLKNNYDAFHFLVNADVVDIFAKDELYRSPRTIALINSPFYKILYRLEKNFAIQLSFNGDYLQEVH